MTSTKRKKQLFSLKKNHQAGRTGQPYVHGTCGFHKASGKAQHYDSATRSPYVQVVDKHRRSIPQPRAGSPVAGAAPDLLRIFVAVSGRPPDVPCPMWYPRAVCDY